MSSEYSGAQTKLPKILLNGNNICMVCIKGFTISVKTLTAVQLIPGGMPGEQ